MLNTIFKTYRSVLPKSWPIALLSGLALGFALALPAAQAHLSQLSAAVERDLFGILDGRVATATAAEITKIVRNREFWIALALITAWSVVVFTMVLVRVGDLVAGRAGSMATAILRGIRLAPPALAVSAAYIIATCVGTVFFVIPGVVLSVSLLFVLTAIIEDGAGVTTSLTRSWKLVSGDWWWTAVTSTIAIVVGLIASSIIQSVFDLFAAIVGLSAPLTMLLESALNSAVLLPFYAVMLICLYNELKDREQRKIKSR